MNKLITITEIIKRGVDDIHCNYSIGQEVVKGKKIPFIQAKLSLPQDKEKFLQLSSNHNLM